MQVKRWKEVGFAGDAGIFVSSNTEE
jgi:hypothetical protein